MNDVKRKLGYFAAFFAFWTLVALSFVLLSSATGYGEGNQPPFRRLLLIQFARFYAWGLLAPLIYQLVRRFPIEIRALRWRSLLIHLAGMTVICTIHRLLFNLASWIFYEPPGSSFFENFFYEFFDGLYLTVIYYLMIISAIQAIVFYQDYRTEEEQKLRATAQLARAELQILKMQLHPHFFFNTLNAISALIYRSPKDADRMITQLGDLIRVSLKQDKTQEISLKEELDFLDAYLQIHQTLMGKRLKVEWKIEQKTLDALVPNLILQPLAENAIEHGLAPLEEGGRITINANLDNGKLVLQISDNGCGFVREKDSKNDGIGLSNVEARLENLYGKEQKFSINKSPTGGTTVKIDIPFREQLTD